MRNSPPPPEFEKVYIEGGWRAVERIFGPRPSVFLRWLNYVGRKQIDQKRQAYIEANKSAK